ncbi:hypothetical protein G3I44_04105 [Halogeometricum borinquense]|uniref:Uncharacterized protein n=1 Tax=Halogeometricum borinquense TaxID=60847 RepID=A0A6C0UDS8_9EURY|nr:hypothetical protein [Halogeometricum borinquense]QIB73536.1 hypothetical protein G3I44_04105 [Halogeometricum borinquense]
MTFTGGVVGVVHGDFDTLSDGYISEEMGDDDLECYIDIKEEAQDLSGEVSFQEGIVAAERVDTREAVEVDQGNVYVREIRDQDWDWAKFWVVPGEFIIVQNHKGGFPFDQLSQATGLEVRKAKINLTEIVQNHPGQWMGGFTDRPERVRSGTLYGDEIEEDIDMGDAFVESDKNQIGPIIEFDGREIKARVTKDGMVQVVSPGTYDMEKYLRLVSEVFFQYTY